MIPFYQARVGDVQDGRATLEGWCLSCDHRAPVAPAWLRDRFPPFERLVSIEKRLRCTHCRAAAGCSLNVIWLV